MSLLRAAALVCCSLCLCARGPQARPDDAPKLPAATVTLPATPTPLTQVLADVKKQTGVTVESQLGEPDPKVRSVTGRPEPFWKAIDLLAEQAGAQVTILPRDGRILLARRASTRRPVVSYHGPFRFCVKGVSARRDLDTDTVNFTATVEVAWEPGRLPLFLDTIPQDVVAVDNRGGRHPVPDGGRSKAPVDGRTSLLIDVPLPPLPRTASALASLEGRLDVIAPREMLRFVFPRPEAGAALTQKGVTCKITTLAPGKDRWTVRLSIENPPGGTILESYQPWDSNNVLTLVSKDGKTRLVASSYVRESESSRRAVLSYHFTNHKRLADTTPEDWTLEYRTPSLVVTVPVPFSFKDVPTFKDAPEL